MAINSKHFLGMLNKKYRNALKKKRLELGLSYNDAANFCEINVCTYRKWECGPTKRCETCKIPKIEKFLNFSKHYNFIKYNSKANCYQAQISRNFPEIFNDELDQLLNIIYISYRHDEFFQKQMIALHNFTKKLIHEFVLRQKTQHQ